MTMSDPLGDMLTRIRNAQMRKTAKVSTPGSRLRQNVLDVLKAEGYIRGYSTVDFSNGRSEFEKRPSMNPLPKQVGQNDEGGGHRSNIGAWAGKTAACRCQ